MKLLANERMKKYGDLAMTEVPEIEEHYEQFKKKAKQYDEPKFIEVTGKNLYYLCRCHPIDMNVTYNIYNIESRIEDMIKDIKSINMWKSKNVKSITIEQICNALRELGKKVYCKYKCVMEKKDVHKKTLYFSYSECITIAEIYKLLCEYCSIKEEIEYFVELAMEDKEYVNSEIAMYYPQFDENTLEEKADVLREKVGFVCIGYEDVIEETMYCIYDIFFKDVEEN